MKEVSPTVFLLLHPSSTLAASVFVVVVVLVTNNYSLLLFSLLVSKGSRKERFVVDNGLPFWLPSVHLRDSFKVSSEVQTWKEIRPNALNEVTIHLLDGSHIRATDFESRGNVLVLLLW
jgi:hypothetical protein